MGLNAYDEVETREPMATENGGSDVHDGYVRAAVILCQYVSSALSLRSCL